MRRGRRKGLAGLVMVSKSRCERWSVEEEKKEIGQALLGNIELSNIDGSEFERGGGFGQEGSGRSHYKGLWLSSSGENNIMVCTHKAQAC